MANFTTRQFHFTCDVQEEVSSGRGEFGHNETAWGTTQSGVRCHWYANAQGREAHDNEELGIGDSILLVGADVEIGPKSRVINIKDRLGVAATDETLYVSAPVQIKTTLRGTVSHKRLFLKVN